MIAVWNGEELCLSVSGCVTKETTSFSKQKRPPPHHLTHMDYHRQKNPW